MADVVQMPGVVEQIKLVAGLRWRILRNGLRRKNNRWDLIGMVWVGLFSGLIVVGLGLAFYAGGYEFIARGRAGWMALLYWAIFVWWQIFPLFVAGFGSNFEFATLLRFPLSLRAFYLLGLGYGLVDFGAVSSMLWILAMLAGAASARTDVVPAMCIVSVPFVLVNVTIERLVGSWLEKILAKRRWREVFLGLFILSMVSLNFLGPLLQHYGRSASPRILEILPYISWLPGSLAGNAVGAAAIRNYRGVLSATAGLLVWLVVMSGLLWQRFEAQYRGEETNEAPAPKAAKKRDKRQASTAELPRFVSPQVVSVALKEFRYLTRNGFALLTLVLPPIMVMFFTMQFGRGSMLKEHALNPELLFPGIMAYLILILMSPAYNAFAYEGKGIQAYFMAPVRFQDVLLGKNLFLVGLVAFELALALVLLTWRVGWPGMPMFAATIMAGAFAVAGQLTIANWSSLSFPKKMELGKMKGQRNSGIAVWTAFGVQFVLGAICGLILMAGKWFGNVWIPVVAFGGLTAAAVGGYIASLPAMNRLAEEKKELLIETLCR